MQRPVPATSRQSQPCHQTVQSEPANFALLAPPGTGKTAAIKMCCAYFQDVLRWSPGDEFQCLASQNRMSARINGLAIHSWGEAKQVENNLWHILNIGINSKNQVSINGIE